MLFESTRLREFAVCAKEKRSCISTQAFSWWSEATQIRTIALWGIFGGDFIERDGFCAVFVENKENYGNRKSKRPYI